MAVRLRQNSRFGCLAMPERNRRWTCDRWTVTAASHTGLPATLRHYLLPARARAMRAHRCGCARVRSTDRDADKEALEGDERALHFYTNQLQGGYANIEPEPVQLSHNEHSRGWAQGEGGGGDGGACSNPVVDEYFVVQRREHHDEGDDDLR